MADYWIKLYHEIIDDPKMATMPDRLWRRAVELFLLAGRMCQDKSGDLPDTNQLAWLLRTQAQDLHLDLSQLESSGIVQKTIDGWHVVNFKKRQGAASDAERKRQERERRHAEQYANVTPLSRNVTQIKRNRLTESETESETEQKQNSTTSSTDFGLLCTLYEQNIGALTQMISQELKEDLADYGLQLCSDAISEAVKNNVRKWAYVQGILKNWKRDGITGKPKRNEPSKKYETREVWNSSGELLLEKVEVKA